MSIPETEKLATEYGDASPETADVIIALGGDGFMLQSLHKFMHSGKPIYPVAIATSRRVELDNWDRTAVNLPFSHIAMVAGEAIYVPKDADAAALETARKFVESELNRLTERAYEIADRKRSATP